MKTAKILRLVESRAISLPRHVEVHMTQARWPGWSNPDAVVRGALTHIECTGLLTRVFVNTAVDDTVALTVPTEADVIDLF